MRDYSEFTDLELAHKLLEAGELCPTDGTIRRVDLCHEAGKRMLERWLDDSVWEEG